VAWVDAFQQPAGSLFWTDDFRLLFSPSSLRLAKQPFCVPCRNQHIVRNHGSSSGSDRAVYTGEEFGNWCFWKGVYLQLQDLSYILVVFVDIKVTPDRGIRLFCVHIARISDMTLIFCMAKFSQMTS
jgi:hypothetical protein